MANFVNAVPTIVAYIDPDWEMYDAQSVRLKRTRSTGNTPERVLKAMARGKVPMRLFNQAGDKHVYFQYAGETYFVGRDIVKFKQGPRFGQ